MADRFPGFDADAWLLKAVTVNTLYGTQVLAIVRMAEHIETTLQAVDRGTAGPELVELLAKLPPKDGEKSRRFTSCS